MKQLNIIVVEPLTGKSRIGWFSLPLAVLLLSALASTPCLAQPPSSDLARQHLESGIQFYQQGRFNQALNDFQIIVNSMAESEYADDALLRIGQHHLEVDEDFAKAKEQFEAVLRSYPTGDMAPAAYYYLGEVIARSDISGTKLDDALANYQRVFIYTDNPWIPAALQGTGRALERQGKFQEAMDAFYQSVVEHPRSNWAAGSQLAIGRTAVQLGNPFEALADFQRVRNHFPDATEAEEALDWLTLLYRLYGVPELGGAVRFNRDASFKPALSDKFKDVKAVRISSNGIHLLERGRKRVLTFDRTGKLAGSQKTVDPYDLNVDFRQGVVVANEKGLLVGGRPLILSSPSKDEEKGPEQLAKIRHAVRDRLGDLFVYDDDLKHVARFDQDGKWKGAYPDSVRREILRLEVDTRGNLVFLEKKDRQVTIHNPEGRLVTKIAARGTGYELKKPVDVAIDPAGYLYILDEDRAQIAVFDAYYRFVTLLGQQELGGGVLAKPTSLDVDASGDLYVYDDKEKSLVRLH